MDLRMTEAERLLATKMQLRIKNAIKNASNKCNRVNNYS